MRTLTTLTISLFLLAGIGCSGDAEPCATCPKCDGGGGGQQDQGKGNKDQGKEPPDQKVDPPDMKIVVAKVSITEIMSKPTKNNQGFGEWFEVFNAEKHPVDIANWVIQDTEGQKYKVVKAGGQTVIDPNGYFVFGASKDGVDNGGVQVNHVYSGGFVMLDEDNIEILNEKGHRVDMVKWNAKDAAWKTKVVKGASMSMKTPLKDNSKAANWCLEKVAWAKNKDKGTPGEKAKCK